MKIEQCPLTGEEKKRMIANAAYLRFKNRGLKLGNSDEDWIAAEAEIEKALAEDCRRSASNFGIAAYQKVRQGVQKVLVRAENTIHADTLQRSVSKVNQEIREIFPKTIGKTRQVAKQELAETIDKLEHQWGGLKSKTSAQLDTLKNKGVHFFQNTSSTLKDKITRQGRRDDRQH